MIVDRIENLSRYVFPSSQEIAAWLKQVDPALLPAGEIEIRGRDLFVRPSEYETKSARGQKMETHRVYADLQLMVKGSELMQTAPENALSPITEYDAAADFRFFKAEDCLSDIVVPAGSFVVFFPGEAHRPGCHVQGKPERVKKLVFKIRMPQAAVSYGSK